MSYYRDDLAYIHDVGHSGFALAAAPWLLAQLRGAGHAGGLVVDLGCGSGQWAEQLVAAGYDVAGLDQSAAMIRRARRRVPPGRFRVGSFLNFRPPPCVAVTALGEVFSYAFDRRNRPAALVALFRRIYGALAPGGLLAFDVLVRSPRLPAEPVRRFRQADDWSVLVEIDVDRRQRTLVREITSFRRVGRAFRRDREIHRLHLWDGRWLAATLRESGFRVRLLRGYGQQRFAPYQTGFLARKPRT